MSEYLRTLEDVWPMGRSLWIMPNTTPSERARNNQESKYAKADWIFHRIPTPIERPDIFLVVPIAIRTRRQDGISVGEARDRVFERWMRTTTDIEMSGHVRV